MADTAWRGEHLIEQKQSWRGVELDQPSSRVPVEQEQIAVEQSVSSSRNRQKSSIVSVVVGGVEAGQKQSRSRSRCRVGVEQQQSRSRSRSRVGAEQKQSRSREGVEVGAKQKQSRSRAVEVYSVEERTGEDCDCSNLSSREQGTVAAENWPLENTDQVSPGVPGN